MHEGQSTAEGGAVPYSPHKLAGERQLWPLRCGWALAFAQLRKMFLHAGMAINRALLEPHGDGHLPVHLVLRDKHDTISLIPISSLWVSSSPV